MSTHLEALGDAWERMVAGAAPQSLGLSTTPEGRLDLRGLVLGAPKVTGVQETRFGAVTTAKVVNLEGVRWRGLDFSGATMPHLRFMDCALDDCRFERMPRMDWRMWRTRVTDASFARSKLGDFAFGEGNVFERVDFSRADMKHVSCSDTYFVGCTFAEAKLKKVDFNGSAFERCTFEGPLDEVEFGRAYKNSSSPRVNEMREVDFSKAQLRSVNFHKLDLLTVKWPTDGEHLMVHDYRNSLERVLAVLSTRTDPDSRGMAGYFGACLRNAGPRQETEAFHRPELVELFGEQSVVELERLLGAVH